MSRQSRRLWVLNAVRHGRMVRRAGRDLLNILPILQKAEKPMTAGEIAMKAGYSRNDLEAQFRFSNGLLILYEKGMLRSTRVLRRTHPYATMELEWELLGADTLVDDERVR